MSYVQNIEDTEEIIQDTLLKVLEGIGDFRNESKLKTWVYRIAINKSKDHLKYKNRKKRAGPLLSIDDQENSYMQLTDDIYKTPDKILESSERVSSFWNAFNKLPEPQKQALTLTKMEQLSVKEVSVVLNTTEKSIEGLLSRGKKKLMFLLEEEGIHKLK